MKSQVNVINIAGAGISASLILLSYFLPSRSAFFKAIADGLKKVSVIQTRKVTISNTQLTPQDTCKASPSTLTTQPSTLKQKQEQPTTLESQKQKTQPKPQTQQTADSQDRNVIIPNTQITPTPTPPPTSTPTPPPTSTPTPIPTPTPTLTTQPSTLKQKQEQPTTLESQKQKTKPKQSADKSEESSKPNVCPKNLDYYTKKPRPKQTPEECITCKNLITCVCLTDNQHSS